MKRSVVRLCLGAVLTAGVGLYVAPAQATTPPGVTKIASGGFGNQGNSYSWSMAWFKGKLYIGTARYQYCVEGATLAFYYPNQNQYKADVADDLKCPPDKYDLDLRAEIWQLTPETGVWKRVYQAPADIPNPRAPGKFVSRDIGYRGMVVYTEPSGEQALYVGGVTADEYIPELAATNPPRILRTTDGTTFTPLNGAPGVMNTPFGPQRPIGYRSMVQYDGRMFVTASGGLLGDGQLIEVTNPGSASPTFTQVSPSTISIFELQTFNGNLYIGTGDQNNGYSVLRTKATGTKPYALTPIITGGAGRGAITTSVVSMFPFRGRLYVGASGWYGTTAQSELVRIATNDTWELVVGNPRFNWDLQFKYPISNLPDGFGSPFNAHFWRQAEHAGELLVGTNDWSWSMRAFPGAPQLFAQHFGFDMYGSCNGANWFADTTNAYDDGLYNFGARTLESTSAGLFVGSANHGQGTSVWRESGAGPCGGATTTATTTTETAQVMPPQQLVAQPGTCGSSLAWKGSSGATGYSVSRSEYTYVGGIAPILRPLLPNGLRFDPLPAVDGLLTSTGLSAPAMPVFVGTTTTTSFLDRTATAGKKYLYLVTAQKGSTSSMSALAVADPNTVQTVSALGASLLPVLC